MKKGIRDFTSIFEDAKQEASGMADRVMDSTSRMAREYKVSERIENIRLSMDENTPDLVKDVSKRMGDSVDVLTGVKLLEVVQEMLQAQEEYNDILATKLDEALTRIAVLEAVIQGNADHENR
jgi:hypothetical protein